MVIFLSPMRMVRDLCRSRDATKTAEMVFIITACNCLFWTVSVPLGTSMYILLQCVWIGHSNLLLSHLRLHKILTDQMESDCGICGKSLCFGIMICYYALSPKISTYGLLFIIKQKSNYLH